MVGWWLWWWRQELDFQKCRLKDENTPFWQIFEIFFSFDISNGQVVRRSV
jgi:hypothetical protein